MQAAFDARDVGFLGELWGFLRSTRKWWLPIPLALVMCSLLIILSGTGLAPFVFTLF